MDSIIQFFSSHGIDFWLFIKAAAVLLLSSLLVSVVARFAFGKRSVLNKSVSSAIGLLFVYAVTVVLHSAGTKFEWLVTPLPFVNISGDYLHLFVFKGADYTAICAQLLSMIILAFLMNLADNWLPSGKNPFTWLFFRCISIAVALLLHLGVTWLFQTYLPTGLLLYAPVILLGILVLMLLTGALKILVGALLSTVNPLIAALYTFFFANFVGKQITKAVLTTALLSLLIAALNHIGCAAVFIASAALIAYIPFLILLVAIWYVVYKLL